MTTCLVRSIHREENDRRVRENWGVRNGPAAGNRFCGYIQAVTHSLRWCRIATAAKVQPPKEISRGANVLPLLADDPCAMRARRRARWI